MRGKLLSQVRVSLPWADWPLPKDILQHLGTIWNSLRIVETAPL